MHVKNRKHAALQATSEPTPETWQGSAELIRSLGISRTVSHVHSVTSAVTTAWGVRWDEDWIARDLMQNFFDANRNVLEQVLVTVDKPTVVTISAPTPYDLERLFYLGSEKGRQDVGQYGEGFKVAVTCLLRDHNVTPIAVSDNSAAVVRISDAPVVENSTLYPLVYDFFSLSTRVEGTELILIGCQAKLIESLRNGLTHFFYARNSLLGPRVWNSWQEEFALYESTTSDGYVFYRKLRRGVIPEIPVVLVIDKEYKQIEKLIEKDRDRKAFGGQLMGLFYKRFSESGLGYGGSDAVKHILRVTQHRWEKGQPLLSAIADAQPCGWRNSDEFRDLFSDRYYAESRSPDSPGQRLEYQKIEDIWRQEGRIRLPMYFERFGVVSAQRFLKEREEKARKESHRKNRRAPTDNERNGLELLADVLGELNPDLRAHFDPATTHYTVARTDVVLGELKESRSYHSEDVFFSEEVFILDFARALAIYLHEHAHIFGHDGSRGFTDALTELLETVVRNRSLLDHYEKQWDETVHVVVAERRKRKPKLASKLADRLAQMDAEELRRLIAKIPPIEVNRAIQKPETRK